MCKHKNLVIHINTHTWGQVSRYECLTTGRIASGRHRFTQFRRRHDSRCARIGNLSLNRRHAKLLPEKIDHPSNTRLFRFVSIWRREPRTTWGKLGRKLVLSLTPVFSASFTISTVLGNYIISHSFHDKRSVSFRKWRAIVITMLLNVILNFEKNANILEILARFQCVCLGNNVDNDTFVILIPSIFFFRFWRMECISRIRKKWYK